MQARTQDFEKGGFFFEVQGNLSSGGLGAQPPDADENSVFNVLRIVSNCRNFFKLVTSDTFHTILLILLNPQCP